MDRSHKQRLIVGFLGTPLILLAAWFGSWSFFALMSIIAAFSVYELLKLINYPPRVLMVLVLILTPLCLFAIHSMRIDWLLLILLFSAIFTNISLLFYKKTEYLKMSFSGIASIIYPGLCLGSMILLRNVSPDGGQDFGRYIVISVFVAVFATDITAFYVGKLLGKTALFPGISPHKTLEGAIGGFLACLAFMLVFWAYSFIPGFGIIDYLILALFAGVFGQLGDLVESKIKRELGVKNTSNILLEHGGFLDRFDSLSLTAPLTWIYVYIKFFL